MYTVVSAELKVAIAMDWLDISDVRTLALCTPSQLRSHQHIPSDTVDKIGEMLVEHGLSLRSPVVSITERAYAIYPSAQDFPIIVLASRCPFETEVWRQLYKNKQYSQITLAQLLEDGELNLYEALEQVKLNSNQYTVRQMMQIIKANLAQLHLHFSR